MTTLYEAIKAVLTGDATLTAVCTGGVYDRDNVGRQGLTLATLQNGTPLIQPSIFIKWSSENPFDAERHKTLKAERVFFEVFYYEDGGAAPTHDICLTMRLRVRQLLAYNRSVEITEPSGAWCHDVIWAGDVVGLRDEALGNASMERSRFYAIVSKE